ncbi:hypothetical protein HWV62_167 [Athelia sp. TMB]|nr:hypothetical protein HWV62_167 [Athelia sp. TMB]
MVSSAASTSTGLAQGEAAGRPEAGLLPLKLGEIGYRAPDEDLERGRVDSDSDESNENLPVRHPADRDAATTDVPLTPAPVADSQSDDAASTRPSVSKRGCKQYKILGGVTLPTFASFVAQILVLGGTIAAWVLAVKYFAMMDKNSGMSTTSGSLFIYVVFIMLLLAEIVFLDRRFYLLRAERYSFLHPGEILPSHTTALGIGISMSPWNRPPLPTYAAALSQGGMRGTGDVEDAAIAVPPPPAYGNTRNSRLLLTGFLRNSLRAQRPVSEHSQISEHEGERPLSYASQDPTWQEIQDAERAIQLEATLDKLETDAPQIASGHIEADVGLSSRSDSGQVSSFLAAR